MRSPTFTTIQEFGALLDGVIGEISFDESDSAIAFTFEIVEVGETRTEEVDLGSGIGGNYSTADCQYGECNSDSEYFTSIYFRYSGHRGTTILSTMLFSLQTFILAFEFRGSSRLLFAMARLLSLTFNRQLRSANIANS